MVTQLLRLLTVTQTQDTTCKVVCMPDSRKSIVSSTQPRWFLQNAHFYQDYITCVTNNLIDHFYQRHYLHFFYICIQMVFNTHSFKGDSEPDLLSDRHCVHLEFPQMFSQQSCSSQPPFILCRLFMRHSMYRALRYVLQQTQRGLRDVQSPP